MKPPSSSGMYGKALNPESIVYEKEVLALDTEAPLPLALKFFFELRDRKYVVIVDELFRLYEFPDIVHGIYLKYRILPAGWRTKITEMMEAKDPRLDWFKPEWLPVAKNKWLTETTSNFPTISRDQTLKEKEEEYEKVIDEFILNERSYFEKLHCFMNSYVTEIQAIANNKLGEFAQKSLGLDKDKVDFMFGKVLSDVHKATETFLVLLETLTLVPGTPKVPGGRSSQLAKIFVDAGPGLVEAYKPYNAQYQVVKKMFEKEKSMVATVAPPVEGGLKHFNFVELWQEISQSKPVLKNFGVDSILILAIRRFPNYKLFLERIIKALVKLETHPALNDVKEALKSVLEFTSQIDMAVKDNENE